MLEMLFQKHLENMTKILNLKRVLQLFYFVPIDNQIYSYNTKILLGNSQSQLQAHSNPMVIPLLKTHSNYMQIPPLQTP